VEVELDAFSGRPNPRWMLTEAQAMEFLALLRKLSPAQVGLPTSSGLGYRGFILRANGGALGPYEEVRINRGIVFARRGDAEETLADPQRNLERWLVASARGHIDEPVLKHVQNEIRREIK